MGKFDFIGYVKSHDIFGVPVGLSYKGSGSY